MSKYNIVILESAQQDLRDLSYTIIFEYKSPLTAVKYLRALNTEIKKLCIHAESLAIQRRKSLLQYGFNI